MIRYFFSYIFQVSESIYLETRIVRLVKKSNNANKNSKFVLSNLTVSYC